MPAITNVQNSKSLKMLLRDAENVKKSERRKRKWNAGVAAATAAVKWNAAVYKPACSTRQIDTRKMSKILKIDQSINSKRRSQRRSPIDPERCSQRHQSINPKRFSQTQSPRLWINFYFLLSFVSVGSSQFTGQIQRTFAHKAQRDGVDVRTFLNIGTAWV